MYNFAAENEKQRLEAAYKGRKAFHGELHDHSASGGTSDGHCTLDVWKKEMAELKMDFAAILDHRQVRHMYLPEWDDTLFICGTEPGTVITDSHASRKDLHYNMLFANSAALEKVLAAFPEYGFEGAPEGHFQYPSFTRERFGELMDAVRDNGGFFVIPHPRQITVTDDVMDFWFRDYSGIEVFYEDLDSKASIDDYPVWEELLQRGKKVWACAGGDKHGHPGTGALTTIYAEEQRGPAYIPHLRCGDFTSGNAGIRMLLGDTLTGGERPFRKDEKLLIAIGDVHESVRFPGHEYSMALLDDKKVVFKCEVSPDAMQYFSFPVSETARWMRAELFDETRKQRIAIGNPIWNSLIP
ncbi:MAG: hypothetical protein IJS15_10980 [Victivallales bacterium]|nr:hypothetical protein [Victivallales bacterium]